MQLVSQSVKRNTFLGAYEKLRKATIIFVMSVRTQQLDSHCTDINKIRYLSF
jgi:hypothetical protein